MRTNPSNKYSSPRSPWRVVAIIVLLGLARPVAAQDTTTVSIAEAIQMALRDNLSLKQSRTSVRISRIVLRQAETAFLPSLSASLSGSRTYVPFRAGSATQSPSQGSEDVSADLSGNLNLFNGFFDYATLRSSQAGYASQTSNYSFARQQLIFQTISEFLQVVQNLDLIGVAEENLASQQQLLDQINAFYEEGNRSIADVLLQKAAVAQAELQLLTARQTYQISRYTLLQTLGQPATAPFEFAALDVEQINSSLDTIPPEATIQTIFRTREDVLSQELQIAATREQVRAAASGFWPSLSLSASIGSSYDNLDTRDPFHRQFSNNRSGTIGLFLSIPIFDRFVTLYSVQQARQQVFDQQYILDNLRLTVNSQYQQALLNYRTAVDQRTSALAQYQYTQQALQAVQAQYDVGAATFITLTQTKAQDVSAHNSLIAAGYNQIFQYLAVFYQRGEIDSGLPILNATTGAGK